MSCILLDIWKNYEGTGKWRLTCSEELFMPELVTATSYKAEELGSLEAGLFPVGRLIVAALGTFHGVTTHINPEEPRAVEFEAPSDVEPAIVESSFRQCIDLLTVSIAMETGNTLFGSYRD